MYQIQILFQGGFYETYLSEDFHFPSLDVLTGGRTFVSVIVSNFSSLEDLPHLEDLQ